ncbi:MAG TPA: hypothetical protein VGD79_05415 [Thermoanaerobaculia bacterium]|jgi:hypothetical protein
MYERIRERLTERFTDEARLRVERVVSADADDERNASLLTEHVRSTMSRHLEEMYDREDAAEAEAQARVEVREFGGLHSRRQLEKHFAEKVRADLAGSRQAFDFTVTGGSRLVAPPYDLSWGVGNGVAIGARLDGKVFTIPTVNGFSGAGVGLFLTTNEPALVAITPQGTYDWNWVAYGDVPFMRSRGGLGITIYRDGALAFSRQVGLWSVSGATTFSGQKGSGRIADAASPPSGIFGPAFLTPALLNMEPGSQYLVWVWCWQTANLQRDDPFIAFLSLNVPLIAIDAGPQIPLH